MAGLRLVPGSPLAFSGFSFSCAMYPDVTRQHPLKDHKSLSCTWPPRNRPCCLLLLTGHSMYLGQVSGLLERSQNDAPTSWDAICPYHFRYLKCYQMSLMSPFSRSQLNRMQANPVCFGERAMWMLSAACETLLLQFNGCCILSFCG